MSATVTRSGRHRKPLPEAAVTGLFIRHGGTIINVDAMSGSYGVSKAGVVRGAGELIGFDRTGNTYGMEAWVYSGTGNKASEGFVRPVAAP